ncbi:hypothetical protein B0H19DRAFT_1084140 [Mycena capillaripes]|nr:hypothetical protein B0H19DRAFT_1084140 [Mycena capillaripes]
MGRLLAAPQSYMQPRRYEALMELSGRIQQTGILRNNHAHPFLPVLRRQMAAAQLAAAMATLVQTQKVEGIGVPAIRWSEHCDLVVIEFLNGEHETAGEQQGRSGEAEAEAEAGSLGELPPSRGREDVKPAFIFSTVFNAREDLSDLIFKRKAGSRAKYLICRSIVCSTLVGRDGIARADGGWIVELRKHAERRRAKTEGTHPHAPAKPWLRGTPVNTLRGRSRAACGLITICKAERFRGVERAADNSLETPPMPLDHEYNEYGELGLCFSPCMEQRYAAVEQQNAFGPVAKGGINTSRSRMSATGDRYGDLVEARAENHSKTDQTQKLKENGDRRIET